MTATITEQKRTITEVIVRCGECDLFIYQTNVRHRTMAELKAKQHDRYAHAEPPVPHRIAHVDPKLIGYTVECECLYRGSVDSIQATYGWVCPLDNTVQP